MRVSKYMSTERLLVIMRAFIESQFNYCPLVWMFHSKKLQSRIDKLHERALRVAYKDDLSCYEELLKKDDSFSLHDRNLQKLAVLMYQVKNRLCPLPVQEIFTQNVYAKELRSNENGEVWEIPRVKTEHNGIESLRYMEPVTWNLLPDDIKSATSLESFKIKSVKLEASWLYMQAMQSLL